MDVAVWLKNLGLGQYEAAFRDNAIEGDLLSNLTAEDLKDLGVTIVGHRRKLLDAIAALGAASEPTLPPAAANPPPTLSSPAVSSRLQARSDASAERRHLTVLFCDLVGSTAISASLDAEDWRNLVSAYLDAASEAVTQMGGRVAKKLGDGLMALFGHPIAQENDSERAVRAALAIQRSLAELNSNNAGSGRPELFARIGVETGAVVVDPDGEIFGDAPNVAARVQALADPGAVLITARVQRQVAGLFVAEDCGAHALKGAPEPTTLFRIVRASGAGRRSGQRALTPLVGREDEMAVLLRRWDRARRGEGQFVMIVGEPGLGKSRLIEEFRTRLADTPHTWVEWSSSQLLQNTPFHPIADWGRQRFGGPEAPAERRLADLETSLAQVKLDPVEYIPLLAPLVDIPLPPERALALAPEELRRRQLAAISAWYLAGARAQPVVLTVEDLHWTDPTTLEALRGFAERGALAPLLVVATARPEFRAPWGARSHHGAMTLTPLDRAQVRQMVGEIAERRALSSEVVDGVGERTGGVPLFIEEVTRLLLERSEQGGAQAIPPTLQQSLTARLDRLGPAREVAMIGAVLGRGFSFSLLRAVSDTDEGPLQQALEKLAEADILLVEGLPPEAEYRFKHALIQDAAYENLLKSRRQALHRRAAELLRNGASPEPETIARHFTEAGDNDLAIEWWGRAGDQALRRSAFQEAIAHLGKAIAMADNAGSADSRKLADLPPGQKMKLHADLSQATMLAKGYTAKETKEAFARLEEAARQTGETKPSFTDFYARWVVDLMQGRHAKAKQTAQAFLLAAQAGGGTTEIAAAHRALGWSCFALGELQSALSEYQSGLDLLRQTSDDDSRFLFSMDARGSADGYRSCASWVAGDAESWRVAKAAAVERAEALGHTPTSVNIYWLAASTSIIRRDPEAARAEAARVIDLSRTHGLPQYLAYGEICMGWALANLGSSATGLEMVRRALNDQKEQDGGYWRPWFLGLLADLESTAGHPDVALRICNDALALAKETGEAWSDAALLKLRGDILLRRDPKNHAAVETAYDEAIRIARAQGARTFELEAAHALAKLRQSTGRPVEAHAVLSDALEGFAPTPEMPEIAQAQALLAELARTDEVKAAIGQRRRVSRLQVAYGNALIAARGYGAPETAEAFARARDSAVGDKDAPERLVADYGLWVGSFTRGELAGMRGHAATFLDDVQASPDSPEAGVAHRIAGTMHWFAGEYREAQAHLERALALFEPGRDDDLAFRFGQDPGVASMLNLALTLWPLGGIERARSLIESAQTRSASVTHIGTQVYEKALATWFELMRGDLERAAPSVVELARIAREHELPAWRAWAVFLEGFAAAESGASGSGLEKMHRGVELVCEQNVLAFDGLLKIALAQAEARAGNVDRAVATLDEALATCERIGHRTFEAELHCARGELLLRRDRAGAAPAEQALLKAIAVAGEQGTRSFGLRAALSLAKLYRSTDRAADAHAVLAPALEGFAPTPEMPEIAEAQALLATLRESDEVKLALAPHKRRLHLQTAYAQALLWSKGFAADETRAAFERTGDLATRAELPAERFPALFGQYLSSLLHGDIRVARQIAERFLQEAEAQGRAAEAGVGRRIVGLASTFLGDLAGARENLEAALNTYDRKRDSGVREKFALDTGIAARAYLGLASWLAGDLQRANQLIEEAMSLGDDSGHLPDLIHALWYKVYIQCLRNDPQGAAADAENLSRISRERGVELFVMLANLALSWARGRLGDALSGANELRRSLADYTSQGNLLWVPAFHALLAELESRAGEIERALAQINAGLAIAQDGGQAYNEPFLHRLRGDLLLKRNPDDLAPAEDAYRTAVMLATKQGARTYELLASLSLAKLYQSTNRPLEAHAILAPALEGFASTPDMPEIAEGQALMKGLA